MIIIKQDGHYFFSKRVVLVVVILFIFLQCLHMSHRSVQAFAENIADFLKDVIVLFLF